MGADLGKRPGIGQPVSQHLLSGSQQVGAPPVLKSRPLIPGEELSRPTSPGSQAALRLLPGRGPAVVRYTAVWQVPPGRTMEVTVPTTLNVLNGSDARLPCTFNSCYTVNHKQFSLNWTYQECSNCSEEMFLQFRMKIINLKLERFRDRVEFSGNPSKYDVSVTLRNVQLEDAGTYNCYIMNPPDRHRGHGKIYLQVLMEEPPERDSTVAVIVGASVGGFLAVVILVLMVVKCVRRKKEQKLSTDDLKTEEEGKTDGEGNAEDGPK
ncbi:sodium channel subunit beta-2 isoform X2 [Mustela lutreola]|uniref:sodium channel subunit beta-2 isoform X2 n=1 Tax=Mustela lutreola TaxID=9666 RepID=UPI0027971914|nr:sodium channel subunit beta-2 isoform X2 [Mustela lutreola]